MLRFKQYITELDAIDPFAIVGKPAWTESLSTMLFDLPRQGLKDVKIPLSPPIFRRIWPKPVRTKVFHLTDFDNVAKVKKMQGGKRSISAFFNIEPIVIEDGIKTQGGVVLEMMADVLVASPDDIASQPDKTGRRWITLSSLMNKPTDSDPGLGGGAKLKKMENDINEMMIDIIMDYADDPKFMPNTNKSWIALGKEYGSRSKEDNKIKSQIIRDYLDGMEKVMKKHSKPLGSVLTDYTKKRIQDPDPDSGDRPMWDELVVNNFKIEKVLVLDSDPDDWSEDDFGLPIKVWDDRGDIADYITRTVQRIKL
tara:strand:- start:344 stop:1273 length:930 start_codon:yes stop_codon:yes gene_type:complete